MTLTESMESTCSLEVTCKVGTLPLLQSSVHDASYSQAIAYSWHYDDFSARDSLVRLSRCRVSDCISGTADGKTVEEGISTHPGQFCAHGIR